MFIREVAGNIKLAVLRFDKNRIFDKFKSFYQMFSDNLESFLSKFNKINSSADQSILGVDIEQNNIKLIKFSRAKDTRYNVELFLTHELSGGVIEKGEIKDSKQVAQAIDELLGRAGVATRQVALAIPRSLAIIKTITVDKRLTPDEVESRVWIEAQRHFPELINDIFLDFDIVGPSTEGKSLLELVLVASRKNHIQPYLDMAKKSSMVLKVIDVDCFALERSLYFLDKQENEVVALMNLNDNLSTLIVVQNDKLIYSHDQAFNGSQLMASVKGFIEGHSQAADSANFLDNQDYYNVLKANLLSHLRHSLHFFYSSRPNVVIDTLYVSGDCASVDGLTAFIQKEMDINTFIADPCEKLEFSEGVDVDAFKKNASSLMLCCGLAMSRVET